MAGKNIRHTCDILIAGSGFAGSLTALLLSRIGYKVCLVEKKSHPRFAIGESSTPIADMILRHLAETYDLPWLHEFSRYGSWQQHYPEVGCGLKRGFSYFFHRPGEPFRTDGDHRNELLVAASVNDLQSDTNWYRSDLDAFLVEKVKTYGIRYLDQTNLLSVQKNTHWQFHAMHQGEKLVLEASFFIDATGTPDLLQTLWNVSSDTGGFRTNTHAIYSHFDGVTRWTDFLQGQGIPTGDYPYDPDHSALHHLLEEGWLWMLRFNNGRLSMGLVMEEGRQPLTDEDSEVIWKRVFSRYPSLNALMAKATPSPQPGRLLKSQRLQRIAAKGYGEGWVALPHTIGFVDPLHSTGIAHTLCGVEKIAGILSDSRAEPQLLSDRFQAYEKSVMAEIRFSDMLVSGSYKALREFGLFHAWTMLYFTAAIAYEQKRLAGTIPACFLEADNKALREIVETSYSDLEQVLAGGVPPGAAVKGFVNLVRDRIAPYNIAGLLDPTARNMYRHTAAKF